MKLPELQGTLLITERKINDLNTIKSKIEYQLNSMKARTYVINGVIHFITINIVSLSGYVETNYLLFRIYKEGTIAVDEYANQLRFKWSVKLDSLLILAFSFSVIFGFFLYFPLILGFLGAISASFGFFLLFVFLGIQIIKYKITDLIESSVYPN